YWSQLAHAGENSTVSPGTLMPEASTAASYGFSAVRISLFVLSASSMNLSRVSPNVIIVLTHSMRGMRSSSVWPLSNPPAIHITGDLNVLSANDVARLLVALESL